jgi:catechol 2,3-dioxygenase-like lactoylglutathione lyase family enzyme
MLAKPGDRLHDDLMKSEAQIAQSPVAAAPAPAFEGVHHVRLPVSNVPASLDWYVDVLGLECLLLEEEEDAISGAVVGQPGRVMIGLHCDPQRARALNGFVVVALSVTDLEPWIDHLDGRGIAHGELRPCHLGQGVELADPDGILIELHSVEQPSADEA